MESAQPNIQIVTTGFILDISVLGRALVTSWQSQAALVRQCEVSRALTRPLKAPKKLSEVVIITSQIPISDIKTGFLGLIHADFGHSGLELCLRTMPDLPVLTASSGGFRVHSNC